MAKLPKINGKKSVAAWEAFGAKRPAPAKPRVYEQHVPTAKPKRVRRK